MMVELIHGGSPDPDGDRRNVRATVPNVVWYSKVAHSGSASENGGRKGWIMDRDNDSVVGSTKRHMVMRLEGTGDER
jgi:hypothetical protein